MKAPAIIGAGVGSAALCAVASAKPWLAGDQGSVGTIASLPLANALALVALAAWGAFLVLRARSRQAAAGLCALGGVGVVVVTLLGRGDLLKQAADNSLVGASFTGWYWTCLASAVIAAIAGVIAFRQARSWPSMSEKYDAPRTQVATGSDMWGAFDRGDDPTT